MDALSDLIRAVRLSGSVFFAAEFTSPWAIQSPNPRLLASVGLPPAEGAVLFHILIEGACLIECAAHPAVRLGTGDVIVLPHGHPHLMRSSDGAAVTPVCSVLSRRPAGELPTISLGGGGGASRFLCGYLNPDPHLNPIVLELPTILVVRSRDEYTTIEAIDGAGSRPATVPAGSGTWLATTLKFTVNEARTGRPGNAAMLGRLTELMFVEILRQYLQQLPRDQVGWLAGVRDPQVGQALRLLHRDPGRDWTMDDLAREVAMSRSALAQRFTHLIGQTPMRYLNGCRMQLARQKLRESGETVQQVASGVGYLSEAAFNRAFKRATGSPPAAWRKAMLLATVSVTAVVQALQTTALHLAALPLIA